MEGRTYRYMKDEPLYPFGYGLSFSTFEYSGIALSKDVVRRRTKETITVKATVTNTGKYSAEEVVQLYVTDEASHYRVPLFTLAGVKRLNLEPGKSAEVTFVITPDMLSIVSDTGEKVLEPGQFTISVAGSLPGKRSVDLGINPPVQARLTVR
jgi:beta-glucosidase